MIAWAFTLRTSEHPQGRHVIIADDITNKIGSLGPPKDQFFDFASQHAMSTAFLESTPLPIPAHIGFAEEVMSLFFCAWGNDPP